MPDELEVYEVDPAPPMTVNLFGAHDPQEVVARASEVATALTDVIKSRSLFATIQGKSHVLVDGWTLLGSMMGVFPVVVWTRPLENGWEARVEATTLAGAVVGAAEAQCTRDEKEWGPNPTKGKPRDAYALRSMAQTRATSKALRGPLGFIVHLAGFSATPAEEMPVESSKDSADGASVVDTRTDAQNREFNRLLTVLNASKLTPVGFEDWRDWTRGWTEEHFGKRSSKDLTVKEAILTIDELKRQEDQAPDLPFG